MTIVTLQLTFMEMLMLKTLLIFKFNVDIAMHRQMYFDGLYEFIAFLHVIHNTIHLSYCVCVDVIIFFEKPQKLFKINSKLIQG